MNVKLMKKSELDKFLREKERAYCRRLFQSNKCSECQLDTCISGERTNQEYVTMSLLKEKFPDWEIVKEEGGYIAKNKIDALLFKSATPKKLLNKIQNAQ